MHNLSKIFDYLSYRRIVKTLVSLFVLDLALAYPRPGYKLSSYPDDVPAQSLRFPNDIENSRLSWALGSMENEDDDQTYSLDYNDPWGRLLDDPRIPNDDEYDEANGRWVDQDIQGTRDREQQLLNLYYLVASLEREEEQNRLKWNSRKGSNANFEISTS